MLKICSQESNWRRPACPAAGAVPLLLSVCKATWQEGQGRRTGGRGGLRTACLQLHKPRARASQQWAHRSGLVVVFAHPGRRSGEGVEREWRKSEKGAVASWSTLN